MSALRKPLIRQMEDDCRTFNASTPVGSLIRVWPGAMGQGPGKLVEVKEPGAYILSGHTPVVRVSGGHGCVALSHVKQDPR